MLTLMRSVAFASHLDKPLILFNLFNFNFLFFGIEQYIDTSFGYCCIFFYFALFICSTVVLLALLTEHTTICRWILLRGKQYKKWTFFFLVFLKCHWRKIWTEDETSGDFRPSQDSSWEKQFCICIDKSSLCINENKETKKKKMWQARSFCCLFERLFTHLPVHFFPALWIFFPPENETNHVGSTFCLRSTDVKEPLVWTVIPLLKPWAEPYPDTPDAISNTSPPHTPPWMCGFVSLTTLRRTQTGKRERRFAFQMSLYRCTRIVIRNSTQLDSLRVFGSLLWREGGLQVTQGWIYWRRLPLCRMSLSHMQP